MEQPSSTPDKSIPSTDCIIIVGAGVFGLTTDLELRKRGYQHVFALDRHMPPVPDKSSIDISKVIRVNYADPFYINLDLEALKMRREKYTEYFNECEFALITESENDPRLERTRQALLMLGQTSNEACGWVNAKAGYSSGCIRVHPDRYLVHNRAESDGYLINASRDKASGSVSTCYPIASIKLSKDKAAKLARLPVAYNLTSGVFIFPPTLDNVLKLVRHDYRYEIAMVAQSTTQIHPWSSVSTPRLFKHSFEPQFILDETDAALRAGLTSLLPQFKDHPRINSRLCLYFDIPKGDFIIDHHPDIASLSLATGDSGYVHRTRWAYKPTGRPMSSGEMYGSRGGPRRVLTRFEQAKL
ncbi:hypothetical protein BDV41DRAFT_562121 [Aspergillus transmontanensis]|uniref:FAD dependent oxidoreductase domain-containing protein n=1 Tax=Aspergillus transmontanensis TaxID=1034304 RepID=A0A5N6W9I5_9EURO|nr:hypothetical protein BDV41DRAFT_562121 [Aspergillus transmontanensis]